MVASIPGEKGQERNAVLQPIPRRGLCVPKSDPPDRSSGEGHPWKVEEFLQRADMSSKQVAGRWEKSEIRYASQLPPSMRNDVEESDKLVFVGLKLNRKDSIRRPATISRPCGSYQRR